MTLVRRIERQAQLVDRLARQLHFETLMLDWMRKRVLAENGSAGAQAGSRLTSILEVYSAAAARDAATKLDACSTPASITT